MKYSIHLLNKVNQFSMLSTNHFLAPKRFATQIPSLITSIIINFASPLCIPNVDLNVLQVQGCKCTWAVSSEQCCTKTCSQIIHHPAFLSSLRINQSLINTQDAVSLSTDTAEIFWIWLNYTYMVPKADWGKQSWPVWHYLWWFLGLRCHRVLHDIHEPGGPCLCTFCCDHMTKEKEKHFSNKMR